MKNKFVNSMYTPNQSFTYPGKLNTELIQKPKINTPAISDFAIVRNGIRCGEYMNLVQPLTRILKRGTAACAPTFTQSGSITDRKLETGLFEINVSWCKKEFQALCNSLGDSDLIADGLSGYELGGRLRAVIFDEILEQERQDFWKVILFGSNAASQANDNMFSTIDGIWTRYMDGFASYCVKPVTNLLPNGPTSTLAVNQARDTFRAMWGGQSILLKQVANNQKKIWTTGSMWENYYDSLIDNCCVEGSWQKGQDGFDRLYYRGIEVVPLWIADQTLENDTDNPYYGTLRHFAILNTPQNNMIGFENGSDLNNLEGCYDCRTKTTYIEGEFRAGINYAHCDFQVIAF